MPNDDLHPIRGLMLNAVNRAMQVVNHSFLDVFDGDFLRAASRDREWLDVAEVAVDSILDALPEIEANHGVRIRERYIPRFPLTSEELDVVRRVAAIIREKMPEIEPGQLVCAARLVNALEALPKSSPDVALEAFFGQPMGEYGRGWASLYLDHCELRLERGEIIYGEFGYDHHKGDGFQSCTHQPRGRGDALDWIGWIEGAGVTELVTFSDHAA